MGTEHWEILRCPNPNPRCQIDVIPVPHHTFVERTWWKPRTWRLHDNGTCTGCGITFNDWVAGMSLEEIVD